MAVRGLGHAIRHLSFLLVAIIVTTGACGYLVYNLSAIDPLQHVDAIVVLGGEHDGRETYGFDLARQGFSDQVVLSDPYTDRDTRMREFCDTTEQGFTVTCVRPAVTTTRGEAIAIRQLAEERGWETLLVVSWRFHLPRARYIFSNCFDGDLIMRPVPRSYAYSIARWEYTYLYQSFGFAKAALKGSC